MIDLQWEGLECKFLSFFNFFPMYEYKSKVLRWIDGDTVLVEVDLGFYIKREERIRLARINAPELNNPTQFQVRKAKRARNVAGLFCPVGSMVKIQTSKSKKDMYARYIAEVFFKQKNISDYLLEQGVVKEY